MSHAARQLPGPLHRAHPNVYDSYDAIYASAAYMRLLGAGPQLDGRTLNALASYTGSPPASLPYARHDYQRAQQLQSLAAATTNSGPLGDLGDVDGTPLERVITYVNKIGTLRLPTAGLAGTRPPGPPAPACPTATPSTTAAPSTPAPPGWTARARCAGCSCSPASSTPGGVGSELLGAAFPSGPGRHVTIWSNADHDFMTINGRGWGTSQTNYRNGPAAEHTTTGFVPSHPAGL